MQRLITILLTTVILLQSINIQINDLIEIDELIEHYTFHNKAYGDSFVEFVSKHYGELKTEHSQKHKEEQSDHEKLPFQHTGYAFSTLDFVVSSGFPFHSLMEASITKEAYFHYQISYSFDLTYGLLQPPKNS
ncbi:hypothetical protein GCM10011414_07560 [Croceivirga lutea]|uniref:hypothetical protein n=1 Tax=Croceivirga lutea TaxID=1775167 RepID=UPI00163B4A92|nr:hypothetical protein [Croceivirga lutea]GGG40545.1 hypothetical protein GCM10011414_07560 [Croceivirga lutea]